MTELEKWENCQKEAILIKEFLDFASYEANAELMSLIDTREGFYPVYELVNEDKLINAFFNIDVEKLEKERQLAIRKHMAYQEKLETQE